MAAPGWYPDPHGSGKTIYWNGTQWVTRQTPKKSIGIGKSLLIVIGIGVLAAACLNTLHSVTATSKTTAPTQSGSAATGCGDVGPTCDATPKADGRYKVSSGGVFDTGIGAGWIATQGKRGGASSCRWERLNGPVPHELQMIIDAGRTELDSRPTYVQIKPEDAYFWSEGCQPWVRFDHK